MRRRDISKALLASAAGSTLLTRQAEAQTCTPPCFPRTDAEVAAGVTPSNYAYEQGRSTRYADLQTWANALGAPGSIQGGEYVLAGGAHELGSTLLLDQKCGVFRGEGAGSADNGTGSCLVWNRINPNPNIPSGPMMVVSQSWALCVRDMRFKGKSADKPSAAIYVDTTNATPAVTALAFENIWIGTFGLIFDSDNAVQFIDGLVVNGSANQQGDQSKISHITVQSCEGSCIAFRKSQNVLWHIDTATLNFATYGVEVGTRHVQVRNVFCQTIFAADYYLPIDGSLTVEGFGSELGGRLVKADNGFDVVFRRGYFQAATANVTASGRIIDLVSASAGAVTLEDVSFTARGGYAGPALKFYVRGTKVLIKLKNVGLPNLISSFFDISTTNPGDSRRVILERVIDSSGKEYNGDFSWSHGDAAPDFTTDALGQQFKTVLIASKTYDPPSTANLTSTTTTLSCPNARIGDYVQVSLSTITAGWLAYGAVVTPDIVTVTLLNATGATDNLASGRLSVRVTKF